MAWTDERVDVLKKLWMDGLSASQIALELGGVTRNAVIGKVHRLGLSGRGKGTTTVRTARTPRQPSTPRQRPQTGATVGNAALKMAPDQAPAPMPKPQQNFDELVIPISERANIMDLNSYTCRWPIGDPADKEFHYCGRKCDENSAYCAHHRRVAYQPQAERKRKIAS